MVCRAEQEMADFVCDRAADQSGDVERARSGHPRLVALSRPIEAIREAERACEFDPLCLVVDTNAAWVRFLVGDHDAALGHCRRTADLDPQYLPARRTIGAVYLQAGKTRDVIDVLEAAHVEAKEDPIVAATLAHAKAIAGDGPGATALLEALRRLDRPYYLALVHVGLGETDRAVAALDQATVDADSALAHVAVDPRFEPIRRDPRYGRPVELLGLG